MAKIVHKFILASVVLALIVRTEASKPDDTDEKPPVAERPPTPPHNDDTENQIYLMLMHPLQNRPARNLLGTKRTFVVGVNSAVDVIVSGTELMEALGVNPPADAKLHDALEDHATLAESFAYSLSTGTGQERFFTSAAEYQHIVDVAMGLASKQLFTGGNAALIGQHILESKSVYRIEREVVLVGAVGPTLKGLLHDDMIVPTSSTAENDEFHLILEFPINHKWGSFTSPRANRFIFSHDRTNMEIRPLEGFPEAIRKGNPDVAVFSGIHGLESEPEAFRTERVNAVAEIFKSVDPRIATHLEMASLGDGKFVKQVADTLIPTFDSLGLNEQELKAFALNAGGPHAELLTDSFEKPEIEVVSDLIHWLFAQYGTEAGGQLTRVHFHTLAFHIVAHKKERWTDATTSVNWGSVACSQRGCNLTSIFNPKRSIKDIVQSKMRETYRLHVPNAEDNFELQDLSVEKRYIKEPIEWEREDYVYALAPVLVCTAPTKTVGLGDAISAAGLDLHGFLPPKTSKSEL